MTLPELLSDPVRARIYIEVIAQGEMTAEQLMKIVGVKRSTISHHLTRFVDEKVLRFRVEEIGRPVKYYSINPGFTEEIIIEGDTDVTRKERVAFLESAAAHLQVISNLIVERANAIRDSTEEAEKKKQSVTFGFSFLSKEEVGVWLEEYRGFQERLKMRLGEIGREPSDRPHEYIAYGGLTPTQKPG
jgi:DNA-binding transcriptional ArsR family regulator